jgi:benzoyl-CoA reductase/2-hydroxyglutaryl-CoA dehydratase subunit BcrC/BadD/HgdB
MNSPHQISLDDWEIRYHRLKAGGLNEPWYGGPLSRHAGRGDKRLLSLRFDNSPPALRLWNFLLTEEERLHQARAAGGKIVGAMKDLGTAAVMAFSLPNVTAFYPDGAWWVPCIMEQGTGDLEVADALGIDESFCPVRAMLGAFVRGAHFPRPDLLVCSVGATCDDFSAIAQRLSSLGYPILWWEAPHRRRAEAGEAAVDLPGGLAAPAAQVRFVRRQLELVRAGLEELTDRKLDDALLAEGIAQANQFRRLLGELRRLAYTRVPCPLGALEMLVAEMLAIHFCSDRAEAIVVIGQLLDEVRRRSALGLGVLDECAVPVFWVNPVADLKVMNILEECGGRLCGSEFLFSHALDEIPADIEPLEALARTALADPMVGPASDRAERICRECRRFGAKAVVISRIPGASHCATESDIIADMVRNRLDLPTVEIEVPPICDADAPGIRTRLEALIESARQRT